MAGAATPDCVALLDDRDATAGRPTSRLYQGFVREHRCIDPSDLDATWARVEADLRAGLHAVLLIDYEWGAKLLKAGHERLGDVDGTVVDGEPGADVSTLRVLMFQGLARLSADAASRWLAAREHGSSDPPQRPDRANVAGVMNLEASVDRTAFTEAIGRIHAAIAAGETYQVNYTYRLHGQAYGSPEALYRKLRERQPVRYGALIVLPPEPSTNRSEVATTHVLSCSPELFLQHDGGLLTARPMKGTAGRAPGPEGDSETARHLSIDTKNRAENLMIVDLLRNDLGRLAQIGSVAVPELFAVEPHSTLFQMTSTVQARLRPEVGFTDVLRAAFPCGSITGAPKHHTMQLIAALESTPRGLYCGAIGWIEAPRGGGDDDAARCGDFCLSVAIRTLTLGREAGGGLRPVRLGVGAGIVADSRADDEFDECRLKARFVTGLDPGFALFETLRATRENGARHVERHLARLTGSAAVLGFDLDRTALQGALGRAVAALPPGVVSRLRLELAPGGRISITSAALAPLPDGPVALLVVPEPLEGNDPLSLHKTTARAHYDAGVRAAERVGAFDSLFLTRTGRVVEGGRSNLFALIAGRWWTPPLRDGALPGVMRSMLLDDPAWGAQERTLYLDDLRGARSLIVCNALRGAIPARLAEASR